MRLLKSTIGFIFTAFVIVEIVLILNREDVHNFRQLFQVFEKLEALVFILPGIYFLLSLFEIKTLGKYVFSALLINMSLAFCYFTLNRMTILYAFDYSLFKINYDGLSDLSFWKKIGTSHYSLFLIFISSFLIDGLFLKKQMSKSDKKTN